MKSISKIIMILILLTVNIYLPAFTFAQNGSWGKWGSDPMEVFHNVISEANNGSDKIQETAMDGITDLQGSYERKFKITNTLDYIRQNIDPYLQWTVYIGLVVATTGIIIVGFMMVTGSLHKSGDFATVKKKLISALVGVFLLSGFYLIIKLIIGVINTLFGNNSPSGAF